jgi:hypothetical protein
MSIHTNSKLLQQKTKIEPKPQRVNWQHKLVWPHIHEAALRNGWRARAIVKDLELRYRQSGMFAQLHRSTVHNWIATDRRSWKSNVLERVKEGRCWKPGKGRIQLLQPYPEIERSVQNTLLGLRKVGIAVNAGLARSAFIGTIEATHPELLQQEQYKHIPVLCIRTVQN